MHRYIFFDKETGEEIAISAPNISGAIIKSLEMVLDGEAVHPMFVREEKEGLS